MPSVIHGVSWLFIQASIYTGPEFWLGPFDTDVCVKFWLINVAVYNNILSKPALF